MYRSSLAESVAHLRSFSPFYLALAVVLVLVDLAASGARIFVFASKLLPSLTFGSCVRASLANIFLGGVTPSQTGGGPGQIYVLYKEGMPVLDATIVSFMGSFLGTAIFMPVCGVAVTLFADPVAVDLWLRHVVSTAIVVFSVILLLSALALINPAKFNSVVLRCLRWFPALNRWLEKKGALGVWFDLLTRFHDMVAYFFTRGKHLFVVGFGLTALIYFNKFVIAWVVLEGLGISAGFWEVVYAQLVIMLIFYFSPSPGAAGIAEVVTAAVMGNIVPEGYRGAFVLLWRFFTLYASLTVGAVVVLREMAKRRVTTEESSRHARA